MINTLRLYIIINYHYLQCMTSQYTNFQETSLVSDAGYRKYIKIYTKKGELIILIAICFIRLHAWVVLTYNLDIRFLLADIFGSQSMKVVCHLFQTHMGLNPGQDSFEHVM